MKTTKWILTLLLFGFAVVSGAQDVIIFKTGEELKAKIAEVGLSEIKYKKADNPNGPLYTTVKAEVFMIKYENGTRDVFTAPSFTAPQANSEKTLDYEGYRRLYRKKLAGGIVMTAIGAPMIIPGLALTIAGFASMNNPDPYYGNNGYNYGYSNNNDGQGLAIAGAVLLGAGIPLTVVGALKIKAAKRYKKKANEVKATMSFNPIVAPGSFGQASNFRTGAGIRLSF